MLKKKPVENQLNIEEPMVVPNVGEPIVEHNKDANEPNVETVNNTAQWD